jgi:hypothetical protein
VTGGGVATGDQGFWGQSELNIPFQIVIEVFTANASIGFVYTFHYEAQIGEVLKGYFLADVEEIVHI